jgi:hypothetical protein
MMSVYERTDRMCEWDRLMAESRTENSRRRRMIEVPDSLEGRSSRIVKS